MEVLLSAVLGELTSRSINFIISKISKPTPLDMEDRLRKLLLRAQVIIDEARGRHITNQAMLLQLDMLRCAMHRGYYKLDANRYQPHNEENSKDHKDVSHSLSLSKVNSVKHHCFSSRGAQVVKELQETIDDLSSTILDVNELILLLMSYPRMYRQPYSIHLQLANSMFDRQMEVLVVINFLLCPQPHGSEELEVLPIVGPKEVGKRTFVAHVCKDGRVQDHFSRILSFRIHGFTNDEIATFREGCTIKLQNHVSDLNKDERLLVVVESNGDFNEDAWNILYSASKRYVPKGSKIIVMSRFDDIVRFGTTQTLTLKHLSNEAYWYFFKNLTFGSMDTEMHPRFMHLAMQIARTLRSSLVGANIIARLLKENFDAQFWSKVLAFVRWFVQQHISRFGEHPFDLLRQKRHANIGRVITPSEELVIYHKYRRSPEEEVPKIGIQDVLYGSVKSHRKFDVVVWKSTIPPYYSYIYPFEIQELKPTCAKRKRAMDNAMKLR